MTRRWFEVEEAPDGYIVIMVVEWGASSRVRGRGRMEPFESIVDLIAWVTEQFEMNPSDWGPLDEPDRPQP